MEEEKLYEVDEEVLEKKGKEKGSSKTVFNYKISSEVEREIEIRGMAFIAYFYKTTVDTLGIRVPLKNNNELLTRFLEYCRENKEERNEREKKANLFSFTTFSKLDKGLSFFPTYGFYVYPFEEEEPFLIFNQEKDCDSPMKRFKTFVEYYRKKFSIEVRPKKRSFEKLEALDLTEMGLVSNLKI